MVICITSDFNLGIWLITIAHKISGFSESYACKLFASLDFKEFPDAAEILGDYCFNHEDYRKAIEYYEICLRYSDPDDDVNSVKISLGIIYRAVEGFVDYQRAYELFSSCEGSREALNILALMHYYGEYVPQNTEKAIALLKEAAGTDYAQPMINLGYIYQHGGNTSEAISWFRQAEQAGAEEATEAIRELTSQQHKVGRKEIEQHIKEIISSKFGIPHWRIDGTSTLASFGMNRLDVIEFIMELEREYGINIPYDEAKRIKDLRMLATAIYNRIN